MRNQPPPPRRCASTQSQGSTKSKKQYKTTTEHKNTDPKILYLGQITDTLSEIDVYKKSLKLLEVQGRQRSFSLEQHSALNDLQAFTEAEILVQRKQIKNAELKIAETQFFFDHSVRRAEIKAKIHDLELQLELQKTLCGISEGNESSSYSSEMGPDRATHPIIGGNSDQST